MGTPPQWMKQLMEMASRELQKEAIAEWPELRAHFKEAKETIGRRVSVWRMTPREKRVWEQRQFDEQLLRSLPETPLKAKLLQLMHDRYELEGPGFVQLACPHCAGWISWGFGGGYTPKCPSCGSTVSLSVCASCSKLVVSAGVPSTCSFCEHVNTPDGAVLTRDDLAKQIAGAIEEIENLLRAQREAT
jgi:hypothetical protein